MKATSFHPATAACWLWRSVRPIERTREYEHRHRALGERAKSAPMRLTYFRPERAHMAPTVTVVIILSVLGLGALLGMPADEIKRLVEAGIIQTQAPRDGQGESTDGSR